MSEPMVASVLVRGLIDNLVELGAPRAQLLELAGVPASTSLLRVRQPWAHVEALLEAAEDLLGDDRLGLYVARLHDLETIALPGLLFFASRDFGQAIDRLARFSRLWTSAYRCALDRAAEPPRYRYELRRPERRASVHLREENLASGLLAANRALGRRVPLVEAVFEHPREGDLSEYEAWFDCPVRFGAGQTYLAMSRETMASPVVTGNPMFAEHFEAQATRDLEALREGDGVGQRVRGVLEEALADHLLGGASLVTVASTLRTSPRTLQRGLKAEGTSFADELDTVRRVAAEQLLTAGADIAEISWRLGYAEPSVLHRAFKRWTGTTPDAWRAQPPRKPSG
ncbi:MAG: AraC family transcriptional regulator ligand-binding domain-containing protein [Alphaproteobacteria bacterium]|nr:AraC family transcriptional regulator ligand-binding domain-containing protein [Alphaproteobacteria bacterium]MCB9698912.1 AraC family transcriptional regulator ligand-binding domain-containing protein [Alphaproteobacteria bacterium]